MNIRGSRVVARLTGARSGLLFGAVVVSTFVVTYGSVVRFKPLFAPDSTYYGAMAVWFGGDSKQEAIRQVTEMRRQSGWSTPALIVDRLFNWGLVQPRVVLPALSAPFVKIWGIEGLVVVPGLAMAALIGVLTWMLVRRWGRLPALVAVVLVMCSPRIMLYGSSMLTESLSALWGALILVAAWQYQRRSGWAPVVWMVLLTVVSGFTRQASLIPAVALLAAWFFAVVLRSRPNRWGVPALAVTVTSVGVQLLQNRLFPTFSQIDQARQFQANTRSGSMVEAFLAAPRLLAAIMWDDLGNIAGSDPALLVLIMLSTASMILFWRRSESHLLLGALLGIAVYNVATGSSTAFRYAMPGLVFFVASAALLIARVDLCQDRPSEEQRPSAEPLDVDNGPVVLAEAEGPHPVPADDEVPVA